MAKVEMERGPLVGAVLIAVSAAIAIVLNTYSAHRVVPVEKTALPQPATSDDAPLCCTEACTIEQRTNAACSQSSPD